MRLRLYTALAAIFLIMVSVGIIALLPPSPRDLHAVPVLNVLACDSSAPVNIASATTTKIITAGSANSFIYICGFAMVPNSVDNVAIVEGHGTNCGTGTLGMAGGTTAATGFNYGANENGHWGAGQGMILKTTVAGDDVCLITSAAIQLSGAFAYTQANF